ncbi:MAG: glycoside hydrolase family 38 C-terminal domain-containing protein [Pyrinomonadaceae bacterium]
MRSGRKRFLALLLSCLASFQSVAAQARTAPDLTKEPTLYVVGYAHLDTQWRWEYPQVIGEYLPNTMRDNFALFEKYPNYLFNFTGANRYRLMKEYWPEDYARLKSYVAAGRWFPAGSSMEEGDPNSASAESIVRQILYGSHYFRREFGRTSAEYMLPDSFGFPASLPSILAHMGLKGFSTQKLYWKSAARVGGPQSPERTPDGVPFNVGLWTGPDGRSIIAAFNPRDYTSNVREDYSKSPLASAANPAVGYKPVDWPARIQRNGEVSGLFTDYTYFGTGDVGGAPREFSVKVVDALAGKKKIVLPPPPPVIPPVDSEGTPVQVGDGPVRVLSATSEQMFLDIKPEQTARLPRYSGDLLLSDHSAGSTSSETTQKRWNRRNELLADAAERASVAAAWMGGRQYPQQRLNDAWTLVMGGQFHDILPGTATPKAFEFSWNDDVVAANQFAGVLTSATESITGGMDTRGRGVPVVVYNPLNVEREDVVEADISLMNGDAPKAVRVTDPQGREVPAQIVGVREAAFKILFLAKVPSVGYAVYDVRPEASPSADTTLKVSESSLENERYRVTLNGDGDVSSIFDKSVGKELLSAPARLAFQTERPKDWPAWNMDWADQQKPPRGYVSGPARVRVVERGPVRVAVEVERESEGSKFVQTIRLATGGAGERVEFANRIDWRSEAAALKATFPLTASNPEATYNWDVGTIRRGNNDERKYEVPSHQWFDLTDRSGTYGVTVLSDCKYGSDKPDDSTLRLTLLFTPGLGTGNGWEFHDQTTQDWGRHEFTYGLAGHAGDWRAAQTDWQAQRLNQPLVAFEAARHAGALGKSFSLMSVGNSRVRVLAVKKAEESDEVVVRLVELDGKSAPGVRLRFAARVVSAREVTGQEQPLGAARVEQGELLTDFGPYQLRTFALKLAPSRVRLSAPRSQPVEMPYDVHAATNHVTKARAALNVSGVPFGFDDAWHSLPAELLPREISFAGVRFKLAPGDAANALAARGQTLKLPAGSFKRLYLLAASAVGDRRATFRVGERAFDLNVQDWGGFVGQWDARQWRAGERQVPPGASPETAARIRSPYYRQDPYAEMTGIKPGFIKPAPLAWFASHHHRADGLSEAYAYSYLFAYALDIPAGAKTLTLPNDDKVRILAVTVSDEDATVRPAQPLFDWLERRP